MTNKNNPVGRPKGSFQYDEAKIHRTHYMTPKAHAWILGNKHWIEETTRWAPENPLPCQEKLRLKDLAGYDLTALDLAKLEEFLGPLCVDDLPRALINKVLDDNDYLEELESRVDNAEERVEELEVLLNERT